MDSKELADLIRQMVVSELQTSEPAPPAEPPPRKGPGGDTPAPRERTESAASPEEIRLAKKVSAWLGMPTPPLPWFGSWRPTGNRGYYLSRTPARLGVGRAGPRYRTDTILSFLTDHAAARDAVHSALDRAVLQELGVHPLQSAASTKKEFLARPDLGRRLSEESMTTVSRVGSKSPQVQVVVGDGLSATAINVNLRLLLPALEGELRRNGVRLGTTFAIDNSRVAAGDHVARALDADVLCMLVGERPGLKTAESMGAYVTYMKVAHFNEAMRSVISNIHRGGLDPAGDGARQVAALCLRALRDKKTGVEMS
jgi:ethanolamine ammonia-lyase small subunit